jgi:Flp pilus assembly protein CpaB
MLGKTSVSMVLIVVAASLIGIAGIYQYEEGQAPPAATSQPQPQKLVQKATVVTGKVNHISSYVSSAGKACIGVVELPSDRPNNLGLKPGEAIALLAPNESFCTLFGLSKIGKTQILFNAQRITASSLPPAIQAELIIPWEDYDIYRVTRVDM